MPAASFLSINSAEAFKRQALATYKDQYENVVVYRKFCDALNKAPNVVEELTDIPFLPIGFFKSHTVLHTAKNTELVFSSSGTTGTATSKHYVPDPGLYERSFKTAFHLFYGPVKDLVILALLPSYLEREGSSLVYMVNSLIQDSEHPESGFYLDDTERIAAILKSLDAEGRKTLLIGVSFALLDLVENHSFQLQNTMVMETGGMKGRRKELIREELHALLKKGFGLHKIHSEYGMTELLSQAYSNGHGVFRTPPWMRILTRDTEDPLSYVEGTTGGINVIDLANQYSCAFIATQDLGKINKDGSFEILGRFDSSDIRGCNLMVL